MSQYTFTRVAPSGAVEYTPSGMPGCALASARHDNGRQAPEAQAKPAAVMHSHPSAAIPLQSVVPMLHAPTPHFPMAQPGLPLGTAAHIIPHVLQFIGS